MATRVGESLCLGFGKFPVLTSQYLAAAMHRLYYTESNGSYCGAEIKGVERSGGG